MQCIHTVADCLFGRCYEKLEYEQNIGGVILHYIRLFILDLFPARKTLMVLGPADQVYLFAN